jgi:hypothetical protein
MGGMPIALILCVLPVMFIVTLLFSVSGELAPVPMVGFVALVGLVGIVFISLIRQMLRMQPTQRPAATRSTRPAPGFRR